MNIGISKPPANKRLTFLIYAGLILATVLVYWPVRHFQFVNYDDSTIFNDNPFVSDGLTWRNIVWGATTTYYEYWHPLMWWSHMLDCTLFGMNAGPHHLVNLAYHVANTLLVFAVFRRMTGKVWRSAVVAALFGLHPLHVESVAWLAERKDLLSTLFWLLSVWAYVRYVQEFKAQGPRSKVWYWWAVFFFLLGLLSKPMVVTLPFVLLLLDYWPLKRTSDFGFRISDFQTKAKREPLAKLVWEKWPFFGLMTLFCFITWYSVKLGNYIVSSDTLPLAKRLSNIPISYVRYLWKTTCPNQLAVVYLMPDHWPGELVVGATLILLLITWLVLRTRSAPYLVFGWFSFVGMLVPTIGLVPVGQQAIAERYMYVPAIGLFVAAVWGAADLSARWKYRELILGCLTVAVLSVCGVLSAKQVRYWRDSVSLWGHCVESNPGYPFARVIYGRAFASVGDTNKAVEQYQIALRMNPDEPLANLSYGGMLLLQGRTEEATNYLAKALLLDPDSVEAHENMGAALVELHDFGGATSYFAEEIRLNPQRAIAYMDMANALSAQGKSEESLDFYNKALKLSPAYSMAHYYLGLEYLSRGSLTEAISSLKSALKFDPTILGAHLNLAGIYSRQHETAKAISNAARPCA